MARSALDAAMALLGRRDYASPELAARLVNDGFDPAEVGSAVVELAERRLIDDSRYVDNFIRSHSGRGHGPVRIRRDLLALGLPGDLIDGGLRSGPDFDALCRDIRRRRFGAEPPGAWKEKARQARFLQYRGFSSDHIRSALGADPDLEE
jgi:regulatory protein